LENSSEQPAAYFIPGGEETRGGRGGHGNG
jgi:hypothetical protein